MDKNPNYKIEKAISQMIVRHKPKNEIINFISRRFRMNKSDASNLYRLTEIELLGKAMAVMGTFHNYENNNINIIT